MSVTYLFSILIGFETLNDADEPTLVDVRRLLGLASQCAMLWISILYSEVGDHDLPDPIKR
jgi:hypothetical protein